MHRLFQVTAALAALALSACAVEQSPAGSATPHGAATVESLIDAATTYACPEREPSQPNCRVSR